jgi:hypothetical protein
MEENNTSEQVKAILKKEKLSWQKFCDIAGETERSNFRRKLIGWLDNADSELNKIGYRIEIMPINEQDQDS